MVDMVVEKIQRVFFPEKGLTNWAETRYKDPDNEYVQELKQAHLEAIRTRNIIGLERIILIMFIQLSYLRNDSPEDWKILNDLYQKIVKWLENKKGD